MWRDSFDQNHPACIETPRLHARLHCGSLTSFCRKYILATTVAGELGSPHSGWWPEASNWAVFDGWFSGQPVLEPRSVAVELASS